MPKKTDFLYSAIGRLLMYLGYSLGLWKQVLEDKGIREITFPLYYFFFTVINVSSFQVMKLDSYQKKR